MTDAGTGLRPPLDDLLKVLARAHQLFVVSRPTVKEILAQEEAFEDWSQTLRAGLTVEGATRYDEFLSTLWATELPPVDDPRYLEWPLDRWRRYSAEILDHLIDLYPAYSSVEEFLDLPGSLSSDARAEMADRLPGFFSAAAQLRVALHVAGCNEDGKST